jgi:hypothetical protein
MARPLENYYTLQIKTCIAISLHIEWEPHLTLELPETTVGGQALNNKGDLRSCTFRIYRSRAERANGKCGFRRRFAPLKPTY